MNRIAFKFVVITLLLVSKFTVAGYITTDLSEDTYITYQNYDWTWASPVNSTFFEGVNPSNNEYVKNEFQDPTAHAGWMFIQGSELEALFAQLTIDLFKRADGSIIHSAAYWNSHFTHVDEGDFDFKFGIKRTDTLAFDYYETFYVRATPANLPTTVPEPSSVFILALGLFAMVAQRQITRRRANR
ncbi:PEP-CTERM protein-sorting domain-containing protein [Colwellia chukchiensis]|uniref:PEP-CTERM protein-sorting domain-containing protein n=1 Tax=Colwellia chukchiensis TaxID=641665 RepID=A0A1H7L9P4_9GAMM|nr:PEP-CTERM sorting domain-containing protein [Colwellia chukchiensis]SEK95661.1 PEP-CTERM protein-sorting domain-containing protein [Colwellia chukchiensis]